MSFSSRNYLVLFLCVSKAGTRYIGLPLGQLRGSVGEQLLERFPDGVCRCSAKSLSLWCPLRTLDAVPPAAAYSPIMEHISVIWMREKEVGFLGSILYGWGTANWSLTCSAFKRSRRPRKSLCTELCHPAGGVM